MTYKVSDYLIVEEDLLDASQEVIRENFIETMRYFAPPAFEINGDIATCKMGVSPADIADIRYSYQFDENN